MLSLTYSPTNTALYTNGQLAARGGGVRFVPCGDILTNGFAIGSDFATGIQQAHGQFDDLATYNYQLTAGDVADDYAEMYPQLPGTFHSMDDDEPPLPPGGTNDDGGGGCGGGDSNMPNYGTNLWVALVGESGDTLSLMPTNLQSDVLYEIQECTNLISPDWTSYGFVDGPETTNCVLTRIPINQNGNLFLRIRSWQDSTDTGIPDWWWYLWFGQITNVDAYASEAGDGLDNLQKFQLGLNPFTFAAPAVSDFIAVLSTNQTDVALSWNLSAGPVQNYAVGRYDFDFSDYQYDFTLLGEVGSNTVSFVDTNDPYVAEGDYYLTYYQVEAVYTNGTSSAAYAGITFAPPAPQGLTASYNDDTGAATLNWQTPPGAVTGYTILRQDSTGSGFSPIATAQGQTSFTDTSYPGGYSVEYEVEANYSGGNSPPSNPANPRALPKYTIPASIVRGPGGALYLTVAGFPQNITAFRVYRTDTQNSYYPISSESFSVYPFGAHTNSVYTWEQTRLYSSGVGNGYFDVPVTNLVNGVYELPTNQAPPFGTFSFEIQALADDGTCGQIIMNGYATGDTKRPDYNVPFYDGRTQIAQNINFLFRTAAHTNAPFSLSAYIFDFPWNYPGNTNYVFAGFHFYDGDLVLNEFQPFEENNYYENYCFAPDNVDTNGNLDTGVFCSDGSDYYTDFEDGRPTTYGFDTYAFVTGSSISTNAVLSSTVAQWT
jgi:hypothetical protein